MNELIIYGIVFTAGVLLAIFFSQVIRVSNKVLSASDRVEDIQNYHENAKRDSKEIYHLKHDAYTKGYSDANVEKNNIMMSIKYLQDEINKMKKAGPEKCN